MPLQKIVDFIIDTISPDFTTNPDDNKIATFVKELSLEKEVTAFRLLMCFAIDLKNSIKETKSQTSSANPFIKNLRNCILMASNTNLTSFSFPKGLSNRWKFAWAVNQTGFINKKPCITCVSNTTYSRVYNFRSFMLWVVDINRGQNLGIDKIIDNPNEMHRYYQNFISRSKYTLLKVTKIGYTGFIFVADKTELENLDSSSIIDGLGFYIENIKEDETFVALEYDSTFKEQTWQPDSLTGDWGRLDNGRPMNGNDFFLSYYHFDSFGRTFSVSGEGMNFKERVHLPFDIVGGSDYVMQAKDLGKMSKDIKKGEESKIINEAILRYKKA